MPRFLLLGIAVVVVLTVYAVIDCAMSEQRRIRILPKPIWLIVVLLLPVVGPLCWILFGKGLVATGVAERGAAGSDRAGGGRARREGSGPMAPDDDVEFLRRLREGDAGMRGRSRNGAPTSPADAPAADRPAGSGDPAAERPASHGASAAQRPAADAAAPPRRDGDAPIDRAPAAESEPDEEPDGRRSADG